MKKTTLLLLTVFSSLIGMSQTFTDGYFTFTVLTPTDVSLTAYDAAGGTAVIIPSSATDGMDTYTVTYIGYQAFMSKGLTSVEIPNTVTTIVNGAFLFNSLSSVTIPNSVISIWDAAFGSNLITSVEFGENVINIGANAFNGNSISTITIPDGVTTIAKQAFANNNLTELIIPIGITEIGEGTFLGNPLISVTSINSTPPTISTGAGIVDSFAEDRSDIDLFIPVGTTAPYVTDPGALWTGFKSVTETGFASIDDLSYAAELSLYPNPVNAQLTIQTTDQIEKLILFNMNGEIIESFVNPNNSIDVSQLPVGIYFLQIQTIKGNVMKKFVKA